MSAAAQPLPDTRPVSAVFHARVNLAFAALAMVATLPGRTQGLGLITEPLLSDLRIDRVTYATMNLWATLLGSLFCLPCGRLIDRYGSRAVITAVLAGLAAVVLAMSGTAGRPVLAVSLTLSRGLGQSALSVVSLALVGKWFRGGLNYAMGIYSLLVAVGPLLLAGTLKRMGSYDSIFYGLAAVVTVLGIGAWFVPLPSRGVPQAGN